MGALEQMDRPDGIIEMTPGLPKNRAKAQPFDVAVFATMSEATSVAPLGPCHVTRASRGRVDAVVVSDGEQVHRAVDVVVWTVSNCGHLLVPMVEKRQPDDGLPIWAPAPAAAARPLFVDAVVRVPDDEQVQAALTARNRGHLVV